MKHMVFPAIAPLLLVQPLYAEEAARGQAGYENVPAFGGPESVTEQLRRGNSGDSVPISTRRNSASRNRYTVPGSPRQFLEELTAIRDSHPSSTRQYWREIGSGCREMASVDRIKEEIGWLKVPFGLLAVVDASLLGWLAQSYTKANPVLVAASTVAVIVVSSGIFQLNRIAYRLFDDLEES